MRQCPTRADGGDTLIAHYIEPSVCQTRQRRLYHKCFTCAHRNEGPTATPPQRLPEVLAPVRVLKRAVSLDAVARPQAAPVLVPPAAVIAPSATVAS